MEQIKAMKEMLMGCAEGQIYGNLEQVDAKELGEVIDMIKDLAEAEYYCTITEAMEEKTDVRHSPRYYTGYSRYGSRGDMYRPYEDKMPNYEEMRYSRPTLRDPREGRSGEHRKMYMESRQLKDKNRQMQELETYMAELSSDITEMIQDASPEEKQMLQQKIMTLANKIK